MPLNDNGVKNLVLPLPHNGFSNQNSFTDFTISFWILYREDAPLGEFIKFDFNPLTFQIREDSVLGSTILSSNAASAPYNADINLFTRSQFSLQTNHYSSWRFMHIKFY